MGSASRRVLAVVCAMAAISTSAAADGKGDKWLVCEAKAEVFKGLLRRWEEIGRDPAEPALRRVEALRVDLSLAAVYERIGPKVRRDDPRLAGLREDVVAAREAEAANLAEAVRVDGFDVAFVAASKALRACEAMLRTLGATLGSSGTVDEHEK